MLATGLVFGYHGCDRAIGERILKNQAHVSVSENEYDWLGHGAYFWENSFERALQWAKLINRNPQHSKHKIKEPFVVGAKIQSKTHTQIAVRSPEKSVLAYFRPFDAQ